MAECIYPNIKTHRLNFDFQQIECMPRKRFSLISLPTLPLSFVTFSLLSGPSPENCNPWK